jgi:hypothetical protein
MRKVVTIHQPDFMSYLGFFHKLLHSDLYIALNDVQFVSGSRAWTNRDKIKTQNGEKWLTVNIHKAPRGTNINEILLNDSINWKNNNLNLLKQNYRDSNYFYEIFPYIENLYANSFKKLSDFNMASIRMLLGLFDIKIDIEYSSNLNTTKTKSERLVEILTQVDTTHYLSGIGAKNYHVDRPFDDANIEVLWQDFNHPVYSQLHGEFIPYLSSVDLLFNCGIEKSREILRGI